MHKLLSAVVLLLALAFPSLAHADSYTTFDIVGFGPSGTVTLDTTTGVFTSVNAYYLDYDFSGQIEDPVTSVTSGQEDVSWLPGAIAPVLTYVTMSAYDANSSFVLATSSLIGYTGGLVCGYQCDAYGMLSGVTFGTFSFQICDKCGPNYSVQPIYYGALVAVTPEPSTLALLGTGLIGLVGIARKRPKANQVS